MEASWLGSGGQHKPPQAAQDSPTKQIYLMNQTHLCFKPNPIISTDTLVITQQQYHKPVNNLMYQSSAS